MEHGGDTESKNPVSVPLVSGQDWKPFSHSMGFFTPRRHTTRSRTRAPFRMIWILMRQICGSQKGQERELDKEAMTARYFNRLLKLAHLKPTCIFAQCFAAFFCR